MWVRLTATFVPVLLHTPLKTTPWVGEGKREGQNRTRFGWTSNRIRFHRVIGSENAGPHLHASPSFGPIS